MSFRRYEIILPTRYNDGQPVEMEKFLLTSEELVARFGALTMHPEPLRGIWLSGGQRYEDENVKIVVDVEDDDDSADFFVRLKAVLKVRFKQIDIWIISYAIKIT